LLQLRGLITRPSGRRRPDLPGRHCGRYPVARICRAKGQAAPGWWETRVPTRYCLGPRVSSSGCRGLGCGAPWVAPTIALQAGVPGCRLQNPGLLPARISSCCGWVRKERTVVPWRMAPAGSWKGTPNNPPGRPDPHNSGPRPCRHTPGRGRAALSESPSAGRDIGGKPSLPPHKKTFLPNALTLRIVIFRISEWKISSRSFLQFCVPVPCPFRNSISFPAVP
jgi:hypothetical protein